MAAKGEAEQFDPVCGRRMTELAGARCVEYKKRRYFFCSEACRGAFQRRAERSRVGELAKMGALFTPQRVRWGQA